MGALKPIQLIGMLACMFTVTAVLAAVLVLTIRRRPP